MTPEQLKELRKKATETQRLAYQQRDVYIYDLSKCIMQLLDEIERLQKVLQGAAAISNVTGAEMKELREENERLREALEEIKLRSET